MFYYLFLALFSIFIFPAWSSISFQPIDVTQLSCKEREVYNALTLTPPIKMAPTQFDHYVIAHVDMENAKVSLEGGVVISVRWWDQDMLKSWIPGQRLRIVMQTSEQNGAYFENLDTTEKAWGGIASVKGVQDSIASISKTVLGEKLPRRVALNSGRIFDPLRKLPQIENWDIRDQLLVLQSQVSGYNDLWNLSRSCLACGWKMVGSQGTPEDVKAHLANAICGQQEAIEKVVSALQRRKQSTGPLGAFLLLGQTGVGKTEFAKRLAEALATVGYDFIRFDMAQYQEAMLGAAIGTVDFSRGGTLTESLKKAPRSVVLFDEIEKAPASVRSFLCLLLDEGFLIDTDGNRVDIKESIVIMTSTLCSEEVKTLSAQGLKKENLLAHIEPKLIEQLSPSLYSRMEPILFNLPNEVLALEIVEKSLKEFQQHLYGTERATLLFDEEVESYFLRKYYVPSFGLRNLKQAVQRDLEEAFSCVSSQKEISGEMIFRITSQEKEAPQAHFLPFKRELLLELEKELNKKVLGQPQAVAAVCASLFSYSAGLKRPEKPIGAYLFLGPTGVGKTELAKTLAKMLFGKDSEIIRFDMSHFSEPHSLARLIGSPPGYINHEEAGQLTNALMANPRSVVLLDEIEKADSCVCRIFLPLFDEGYLTDAKNQNVSCQHALFIATSNLCAREIQEAQRQGFSLETIKKIIEPTLMSVLSPEIYNRVELVIFNSMEESLMESLTNLMLSQFKGEIFRLKGITLSFDDSLKEYLMKKGYHPELGARYLRSTIEKELVGALAEKVIKENLIGGEHILISYLPIQEKIYLEVQKEPICKIE